MRTGARSPRPPGRTQFDDTCAQLGHTRRRKASGFTAESLRHTSCVGGPDLSFAVSLTRRILTWPRSVLRQARRWSNHVCLNKRCQRCSRCAEMVALSAGWSRPGVPIRTRCCRESRVLAEKQPSAPGSRFLTPRQFREPGKRPGSFTRDAGDVSARRVAETADCVWRRSGIIRAELGTNHRSRGSRDEECRSPASRRTAHLSTRSRSVGT